MEAYDLILKLRETVKRHGQESEHWNSSDGVESLNAWDELADLIGVKVEEETPEEKTVVY